MHKTRRSRIFRVVSMLPCCASVCSFLALADGPARIAPGAGEPPRAALEDARARTLPPDELARRREQGTSVLLEAAAFDPLAEPLPAFAAGRVVLGSEEVFLVQFRRDLFASERKELEGAGIRFVDYVPSHAYLVRASFSAVATLRAAPLFRWLDAYRGGYKLAPVLRSEAWTQDVFLNVHLLPSENALELLERLQAIDPSVRLAAVHGEVGQGATLRVLVPAGHLHPFAETAAEDRAVWSIEPWYLPRILNDNSIWVLQSYDTTNRTTYALSATLWSHGITGTGQTPAISDTGLDDDTCYFRKSASVADVADAQVLPLPSTGTIDPTKKVAAYYVLPNATAYDGNTVCGTTPESFHGTHVTGSVVGDNFLTPSSSSAGGHDPGDGMAPNARVIFQDAGSELSGCLDGLSGDFHLIFQQAYDAGARVHSNSWGSAVAGAYTGEARDIDEIAYAKEDLLMLFANGNGGPSVQSVVTPATAKNCVAVGATSNGSSGANTIASFSSRGPTSDGRRKPDIVAPGASILSASGDASHASNTCGVKSMSGTSMATPTAAGAATLLRQYFTDGFYPSGVKTPADAINPSAALLKAALVNGAVDIAPTTQAAMLSSLNPNNDQGFGRIQLDNVAFFSTPSRDARRTRVWDKWNATGLATGQVDEYPLQVAAGQPLKVALVWTDPAASLLAATKLVNDLDLEVVDPSSTLYRGNAFASGQSAAGGVADHVNTTEIVFRSAPVAGTWTVRVKATSVPGTPTEELSTRQGYALVVTYADCTTALAAPAALAAIDNGTTSIDLTWNAVGGAAAYQVYRAEGTCGAPASAFRFVGSVGATSFSDSSVQGGYAYAYRIRAANGCSEGAPSACATATYSGNCNLSPAFSGIGSAENDTTTPVCDSRLEWDGAASSCPLHPGVSYDVYRSTDPYFVPGPGNLLAAGEPGTSYQDTSVIPNTTYYYAVRGEDGSTTNGGPANGGNVDQNRVVTQATPTSAATYPGNWLDGAGDGTARLNLTPPWQVSNQQNHTTGGGFAYHSGPDASTYPANTCASATTPPLPLQPGVTSVLSYWARYDLENQWDGVVVEISSDGGLGWTPVIPTPPYPDTLTQTGTPPINACGYASTQQAFTGPNPNGALTDWTRYTSPLTGYAGQTVLIRWRFTTDPGAEFEGFYLDDIAVTKALVPASCGTDARFVSSAIQSDTCSGGGGGGGNGVLEAGEDAVISVKLQNIGDTTVSGVSATLSTNEPGVVIIHPTAAFVDIDGGAIVDSSGPHFGVSVAPTVACGTSIPFSLQVDSAQGSWTRTFTRAVGAGSPTCTQTVCSTALPVEDGVAPDVLRVAKGTGEALDLTFGVSCHTADSTVYWGAASGAMTGVAWTSSACGFGSAGTATVNITSPSGSLLYFVVVPQNGVSEGSYGRSSAGAERPQASGLGACDLPQQLGGTCP